MHRLTLLCIFLLSAVSLSAQEEDYIAITLRLGEGVTTRNAARFNLDADGGDLGSAVIRDGKFGRMPGQQYGIDIRTNTNGRALFSLAGDYFRSVERDFEYATITSVAGNTLPVLARNDYESFGGSLGVHYRVTSPERRADVQLGGNYHYTRYRHVFFRDFTAVVGRESAFPRNSQTVDESGTRHGLSASARFAYPIYRTLAFNAEARYGLETEEWSFSPIYSLQFGIQISFWNPGY